MSSPKTTADAHRLAPPTAGEVLRRLVPVFPEPRRPPIALGPAGLTLGRDPGPGGLVLHGPAISRRHATLTFVPAYGVFRVEDAGSRNGTHLDGQRVTTDYLQDGSVLRIGETIFVYEELRLPTGAAPSVELDPRGESGRPLSLHLAHTHLVADRAARTSATLLLHGPTGAGKERLAARIHHASGRPGPLVTVNCASFSRELVAAELFGVKKGAFTHATADRKGLFVAAARGTLFLDEIAELPLDQQPVLLRALEERRVRPVGGEFEVPVDVRVIAATHQDLGQLVARGAFRADLHARLSGLVVELPGLARRRSEILGLLVELLGPPPATLNPDVAEALLLHDWPMNVRELQRVAQHVALFRDPRRPIDRTQLPPSLAGPESATARGDGAPTRAELEELLRRTGGNVSWAAAELGRHRNQVHRWMNALGIDPGEFRKSGTHK